MEDKRKILKQEQPFSYKEIKDDKVQVFFEGKFIKTLSGKEYTRFHTVLVQEDPYSLQLFLAKITGQFKRGNEKLTRKKGKGL